MVGILLMLSMDLATLKAAILYPFVEAGLISQEKVNEDFGPKIAKLVEGVLEMEAIRSCKPSPQRNLAGAGGQRAPHAARHGRGRARRGHQAGGAHRLPA
jgi:(p)ppGpp synthase/HD superfamily hydrolase